MGDYVPKIVHLPGTELTPEVVLHRTLGKLEHIKAVVVIIQWKNESFDSDWSMMKVSELCMAERALDYAVNETMFESQNSADLKK